VTLLDPGLRRDDEPWVRDAYGCVTTYGRVATAGSIGVMALTTSSNACA